MLHSVCVRVMYMLYLAAITSVVVMRARGVHRGGGR